MAMHEVTLLGALAGLVAGSFLTAVVHRLPRGQPLWRGRSACPACGTVLAARDLVPLLSYLWLRGRCRHCRAPIPLRYPVLEGLTAAAFALAAARWAGQPLRAWELAGLYALLLAVAAIDLEHLLIPNRLVAAGLAWEGVWRLWLPPVWSPEGSGPAAALGQGLAGAALLLATMALIQAASRGGIGGGDVKLAAVIGLALGPRLGLLALGVAFVLGGLAGAVLLAMHRVGRRDPVPFAPFLVAGTAVAAHAGPDLVALYGRLLGWEG